MLQTEPLPPYCPEAERGVLGCCLLDVDKTHVALRAGVTRRWFYETRHADLFELLATMALDGGGDVILTRIALREKGKLEAIGGLDYLMELMDGVPSAENLEYYLPELRGYLQRRLILDVSGRLGLLARDLKSEPGQLLADTETAVEVLRRQTDSTALPDIVAANAFLATEMEKPPELVEGVLHQGSKLILGGASKSYKTWTLTDLAVSIATGAPWLGFPTRRGKVLYVNLEIQAAFFQRRIAEVIQAKGVEIDDRLEIWNLRGHSADYRVLIPKIRSRIRDAGYSLVIVDPTYKLLGAADENSASDIASLLSAMESIAVTTGAAVAMAGHFAKGNAAAKETIDRISGSGVFARDPDSLITFTRHEEEGAFTIEFILRNLAPVDPFVVTWQWPLFGRDDGMDPTKLKQVGGRPPTHTPEELLECLGDQKLTATEWQQLAAEEYGISRTRFFALVTQLKEGEKVGKSAIDGRWYQISKKSRNYDHDFDQ